MGPKTRLWLATLACVAGAVGLAADTLYLRNGRRVDGTLVSVRDGIVEFQPDRGRLLRVPLADVRRIDLDEESGPAPGAVRPPGLRERVVTVLARTAWTDTGLDVRTGQVVYFEASGRVRWGRDRRDGPAGERNSPPNDARPLPTRPAAALIGRVGDGSDVFFIGDERGGLRMRAEGRLLYLGINDDYLEDNADGFRVVIYY